MKSRLGWLGPVIVAVGLVVGGIGVWWMFHARPRPGDVIDVVAIDGEWAVVVRHEAGTERAFVELVSTKRGTEWQALVPPYAGRPGVPGIALAKAAISVRVNRNRAELWSLSTRDAAKLGALSLGAHVAGTWLPHGPSAVVSASDAGRSFEVIDGTGGATIVGIDLEHGAVLWDRAVGAPITSLRPIDGAVEIVTPTRGMVLDAATGAPIAGRTPAPPGDPAALSDTLRFADHALVRGTARFPWPAAARPPLPHQLAGRYLWMIEPERLAVLDTETLEIVGSHPLR